MTTLSVVIITKNEAHDLRECLESISWANEIIVLDSGSTDNTLAIAREFTPLVHINNDWQGFGVQKNRALSLASSEWVLALDADERISESLKNEIQEAIIRNESDVYIMPRLSSYCGRFIHHSGWHPDFIARLFKRGTAAFSNDLVHESLIYNAKASFLKSPILHLTYKNLDEVISKINQYSSLGAENALKKGAKASVISAITHGLWAFFRAYFIRRGFLDGAEGLMLAISNAEVTYYRYLKLYYLSKNSLSSHNSKDQHVD